MPTTDESIMPFGKHKGKRLVDIEASYFIYLHENVKLFGGLKQYVEDNLEYFRIEIQNQKKGIK